MVYAFASAKGGSGEVWQFDQSGGDPAKREEFKRAIQELDRKGQLLGGGPELLRELGEPRVREHAAEDEVVARRRRDQPLALGDQRLLRVLVELAALRVRWHLAVRRVTLR